MAEERSSLTQGSSSTTSSSGSNSFFGSGGTYSSGCSGEGTKVIGTEVEGLKAKTVDNAGKLVTPGHDIHIEIPKGPRDAPFASVLLAKEGICDCVYNLIWLW